MHIHAYRVWVHLRGEVGVWLVDITVKKGGYWQCQLWGSEWREWEEWRGGPTRIPGWGFKSCICVRVWFGALRSSITHIRSLLLRYLQFLLGVLQGLWVFIQLIFSSLQFLLHLNQLILMLGERNKGIWEWKRWKGREEWNIIVWNHLLQYIFTQSLLPQVCTKWHFPVSFCPSSSGDKTHTLS